MLRRTSEYLELRALWEVNCARVRGHFSAWRLYFVATLKRPYFLSFSPTVRVCVCAHIIDQGLVCLIRSIDSNMADLGLHITLLPISRQALPSSAATCQNQLLVLQIGLCLFLYVFPVFELLSVLFCSVLLCLGGDGEQLPACSVRPRTSQSTERAAAPLCASRRCRSGGDLCGVCLNRRS